MNSLDSQLWRELKKHRSNSKLSRRRLPCSTPAGRGTHINTCCPRLIKDIGRGRGEGVLENKNASRKDLWMLFRLRGDFSQRKANGKQK